MQCLLMRADDRVLRPAAVSPLAGVNTPCRLQQIWSCLWQGTIIILLEPGPWLRGGFHAMPADSLDSLNPETLDPGP